MSWFDDFFEYLRWRAAVAIQAGMSDAVRGDIEQGTAARHLQAAGQLEQHLATVRGGQPALPGPPETRPESQPGEEPRAPEAGTSLADGEPGTARRQDPAPPPASDDAPTGDGFDARLAQAPGLLSRQLPLPARGKKPSPPAGKPGQRKEAE